MESVDSLIHIRSKWSLKKSQRNPDLILIVGVVSQIYANRMQKLTTVQSAKKLGATCAITIFPLKGGFLKRLIVHAETSMD